MPVDTGLLQKSALFSGLDGEQLGAMAELCTVEFFASGSTIYIEEHHGTILYLVQKGEAEIFYSMGEEGDVKVDRAGPGEVIGCSALFEPYMYNATVRACTDVTAIAMNIVQLRELLQQSCSLPVKLYEHIIQNLLDHIVNLRLAWGK